jgi:NADH-quinone oxidoreductase subunit L
MGFLAIVNHDIKRVIAYSTISQLGYMTVALGASAYDAAIFHLITHAFFKALLFLAAGSVIIAMHHEQDMRKMGGLVTRMPITYLTFLIGSLALAAIPPFSGFFSKDMIIDAVHLSTTPGATYAYYCVLIGAFFTPLYTFRALFLTFHGVPRMDQQTREHVKESPWVVLLPLIGLAIPSLVAGGILIGPMLFAKPTLLNTSIFVLPSHNVIGELAHEFVSATHMALTAGSGLTLWLALGGIVTAWLFNLRSPQLATRLKTTFPIIYKVLMNKYGFDEFNQKVIVNGSKRLGSFFYNVMDLTIIDGFFVNGLGRLVRWFAFVSRLMQTGYIYHYSLAMILGVVIFLGWFLLRF